MAYQYSNMALDKIDRVENQDPITIFRTFSKILEHAIPFLITFYDGVINSINAGECAVQIFCDLSMAFDSVDHNILLQKLDRYGIKGVALEWFSSCLTEQKQFVEIPCIVGRCRFRQRSKQKNRYPSELSFRLYPVHCICQRLVPLL